MMSDAKDVQKIADSTHTTKTEQAQELKIKEVELVVDPPDPSHKTQTEQQQEIKIGIKAWYMYYEDVGPDSNPELIGTARSIAEAREFIYKQLRAAIQNEELLPPLKKWRVYKNKESWRNETQSKDDNCLLFSSNELHKGFIDVAMDYSGGRNSYFISNHKIVIHYY